MIGYNLTFRRFLLKEIKQLNPEEIDELENLFAERYQLLEEERISTRVRNNQPNNKRRQAIFNREVRIGERMLSQFDNRFHKLDMEYMENRYRELHSGYLIQWPRDLKYLWILFTSKLPTKIKANMKFNVPFKKYMKV